MLEYTKEQRRLLAEFFMTIAAAWFAAGVITSVFSRTATSEEVLINIGVGLLFTYISLRFALKLIR
ncbi:hypothetical protein A2630_01350 [Candidatus Woesebacteria bacterium RIFCSPHIGHO2_01_FULL_44_10]|uniref:Uncharacterized protein n=1 Tax=Candidatus Woesebacteria bacterium RIFCSPLOWO2_01_FULL_44_14 TaxID=1802525 RepID=A0A1F8C1B5_9BACT|nr:MAG: hypothetical protein A2630_01350 [Candidatus Woesebacteria bacterium RIFCSPHIGHO2_01_FULL_44_10]OGM55687.1 MAG: hypothetical protein A3F62_02590 [Candidatus Woesebacteria bacterium RIFCSPHIGHO2_12_FULL_44_11]OGM70113.1 MAG: hypothetical protein A2975_03490 [Candidatus Woesebacteria bacterium RIFCSPLOWO2_01_FULL_44_14]